MTCSLLFVCLGNICRSPAAEGVFLNLLHSKGVQDQFVVDSAGTGGWHVGKAADSRMRSAAKRRGVSIDSIARQISSKDLHIFDLILTMDSENLADVTRLAEQTSSHSIDKIKPILTYAKSTDLNDVPDPYYGGEEGFEKVLDLLEDACEGLFAAISSYK